MGASHQARRGATLVAGALLLCGATAQSTTAPELSGPEVAWRVAVCCLLVLGSAYCSGLTLAVMGLDPQTLEITRAAGSPQERAWAASILPVRKKGNQLLASLLWSNMAVNSLLSILMADLTSGVVGFVVSTVVIVLLGEILPQASCSRHALRVGSFFVPSVKVLLFVLYPVSKPIALVLDYFLGEEVGTLYSKRELASLLSQHVAMNLLHPNEAAIMAGAITFRDKLARDVMTPVSRMFALKASDRLDHKLLTQIYRTGYSRVPVWDDAETGIIGVLYAKDLMLLSPAGRTPVATVVHFFNRHHLNVVDDEDKLGAVLRQFNASRQHFAIVRTVDASAPDRDPVYAVAGVITMQDVMDEIMGEDGRDEYDAMRGGGEDDGSGGGSWGSGGGSWGRGGADGGDAAGARQPGGDESTAILGAAGPANGGGGESAAAAASPHAPPAPPPRNHGGGLPGGRVDGGKSVARVMREEAALRRLRQVAEVDAAGRGVNNDLTGQEVRALAAHLLFNVPAFRAPRGAEKAAAVGAPGAPASPTPPRAAAFTFEMVERLVRQCDVVDILAPERAVPPPGAARRGGGGSAADHSAPAFVDPTSFGLSRGDGGGSNGAVGAAAPPLAAPASWLYVRGEPSAVATVVLQGWLAVIAGADAVRVEVGPWDVLAEGALAPPAAAAAARGGYAPDFSACPLSPVVRCLRIRREDYLAAAEGTLPDLRFSGGGGGAAGAATGRALDVIDDPAAAAMTATAAAADLDVALLPTPAPAASAALPAAGGSAPHARRESAAALLAAAHAAAGAFQAGQRQLGQRQLVAPPDVVVTVHPAALPTRLTTLPATPFSAAMEAAAPMLEPGVGGHPATGHARVASEAALRGAPPAGLAPIVATAAAGDRHSAPPVGSPLGRAAAGAGLRTPPPGSQHKSSPASVPPAVAAAATPPLSGGVPS